jgi:UDP-N-acetylmuramate dehydrogenase
MNIDDIEKYSIDLKGKFFFDYELKKTNWFNIGGKTKIYYRPETLQELIEFLKLYNNRGKIFVIGAGSNILFQDSLFNGVVIKLGKNFSKISLLNHTTVIVGTGTLDKQLSEFALENSIGGFEFLSCIPGTVGGGLRMNSGCFNREIKDILISVQAIDRFGKVSTIPANKIKFSYRKCDLPEDIIFLSATFKGSEKNQSLIKKEINSLKIKKELVQPTRIKTGGSTFKNPINQTDKKVWKLIKESIQLDTEFGDAAISQKHCNFFINKNNANYKDMKKLIDFVKNKVMSKTGIKLDLEIILVE